MELAAFGVDTLRVAYTLTNPLPVSDSGYVEVLACSGWQVNVSPRLEDSGNVLYQTRGFYQDPDLKTYRAGIESAGRVVWVEASIPAFYNGGIINTALADPCSVPDYIRDASNKLLSCLPEYQGYEAVRVRKCDLAADVQCEGDKLGVIAAGSRFRPSRARKITRGVFPGESAFTSTPSLGFKTYDKALELSEKMRREDPTPRQLEEEAKIGSWASGLVRMEMSDKPKTGVHLDTIAHSAERYAEVLRDGLQFGGNEGTLYIGGLAHVHRTIQSMDLPPTARARFFKFAYELATFGEDAVKQIYPPRTFRRIRSQLREAGVIVDDLFNWDGVLDFNPLLEQIHVKHGNHRAPAPRPVGPARPMSGALATKKLIDARVKKLNASEDLSNSPAGLERSARRAQKFFEPVSVLEADKMAGVH